jgi:putative endonuclease
MKKANFHRHTLGKKGEDYCVQLLEKDGYEIVARNFRSLYGEIDIIARHAHHLVFIEVKTRATDTFERTMSSVTRSKQKKLTRTAMFFLAGYQNPEIQEYRFDVIILKKINGSYETKHLKNAFPPSETGDFFP